MSHEKLFADFKPVSVREWEEKIMADLKGADYEKRLVSKTLEGIKIKPYYRGEDIKELDYLNVPPGSFPYVRASRAKVYTQNAQTFFVEKTDADSLDRIKELSERGVDIIHLSFVPQAVEDFNTASDFIAKAAVFFNEVRISGIFDYVRLAEFFAEKKINGSIGYDPLGTMTACGKSPEKTDPGFESLLKNAKLAENLPDIKILSIKANHFGNAGAHAVQEIAFALAQLDEYLNAASDRSLNITKLLKNTEIRLCIASHYFIETAKLRTMRLLAAKLGEAYIGKQDDVPPVAVHAESSAVNKTAYSEHTNILRGTTEAMSAIIGAAESFDTKPFTIAHAENSVLAERVARNTQIILSQESYLNRETDPAGGAYYIEKLTDMLAEKAWKLFRKLIDAGGYTEAFRQKLIHKEIEKVLKQRRMSVAMRKTVYLGVNHYPNPEETLDKPKFTPDANGIETDYEYLAPYRAAEDFERMRYHIEKLPIRPKVFLLGFGSPAMKTARISFSANFFGCAGFEIIAPELGFSTVKEGMKAAAEEKADIVVFCSSDKDYQNITADELSGTKAELVLAGKPQDEQKFKDLGIETFIHLKSDILKILQGFIDYFKPYRV